MGNKSSKAAASRATTDDAPPQNGAETLPTKKSKKQKKEKKNKKSKKNSTLVIEKDVEIDRDRPLPVPPTPEPELDTRKCLRRLVTSSCATKRCLQFWAVLCRCFDR